MGGDHAPAEIVKGAVLAAAEYPVEVVLVGQQEVVRRELEAAGGGDRNIEVVDAREVVEMDDTALAPLRRKRNSSVRVCANLVAEGRAAAFVSAGNTGATWTSARAVMGHFYAQMVFGIEAPRIGLLSIGEEEGKGNELTKETFRVLEETGLNFIGNAEGRDIYNGAADVVVCDGFTGNVVLKASEALAEMVFKLVREEISRSLKRKLGGLLAKGAFVDLKKRTDYSEYGGAPLLGVKGGCIVCHGRSDAKAVKNAVRIARVFALNRVDEKIRTKINDLHRREHDSSVLATDTV